MIRSFRHKGLRDLFETGRGSRVRPDLQERVLRCPDVLDAAKKLDELRLPGFGLHLLHGKPRRYAMAVNGPWRITFEWDGGEAFRVDLEQYH
ncbi:MAG TPA: type II toxin-antitoxin system RelE/ParE family toxin [Thermoanaerobaculia bacterium]|nr:type II toxin-antitoxin system RelE/ParE family toxin [Thermoanaerobaculia bacterium]